MKKEIQNFKIVLENQILRRLLYSNLVSLAGDAASMIVIPLLVLEVTNSASNVVVALLSGTLGTITGAQVILPKLKSIHPSKLCQISNLAQALLTILIIFASYLPYFEISILPLAFVQYIFVAIARTSTQYIIKEAVEQTSTDLSIHFNSAFEFSTYFGRTVGPLVVGLILWLTNLRTALIFDAATFVASALILRGIVFSYTPPTEKISIRRSLAKYPKFKMLFYMLMPVSNNFAFSIFSVTCYVHLVQNFSLESGEVAVFDAFEALALLLGTLLAPVLVKNKFFYPLAFALVTMGYYGFYLLVFRQRCSLLFGALGLRHFHSIRASIYGESRRSLDGHGSSNQLHQSLKDGLDDLQLIIFADLYDDKSVFDFFSHSHRLVNLCTHICFARSTKLFFIRRLQLFQSLRTWKTCF